MTLMTFNIDILSLWLWYNYINITMSSIFAQPATTPPPHASVSGMMFPMHSSRPAFKAVHHGSKATKISFNIAKIPQDTNCRKASLRCSETASVWTPKKGSRQILRRAFRGWWLGYDQSLNVETCSRSLTPGPWCFDSRILIFLCFLAPVKNRTWFHFDVKRGGRGSDLVYINEKTRPNCTRYCCIYFTSWWLPSSNLSNG